MVIPQGVADEIQQGDYDDAALSWIRAEGQAFLKETDIDRLVAAWDLGPGESHALSWAFAILPLKLLWTISPLAKPPKVCKSTFAVR